METIARGAVEMHAAEKHGGTRKKKSAANNLQFATNSHEKICKFGFLKHELYQERGFYRDNQAPRW